MRKWLYILPLSILLFTNCDEDDLILDAEQPNVKVGQEIKGEIIKGPFREGSTIHIYELNNLLEKTGNFITTSITSNMGVFAFDKPDFNGGYVLVTGKGYFYNELYNEESDGEIELNALVNIDEYDEFSVNFISHVLYKRTQQFVKQNYSIEKALEKAIANLCSLYDYTGSEKDFHKLSLVEPGDNNAILYAATLSILQGGKTALQISTIINTITEDFRDNGKIDQRILINNLKNILLTQDTDEFDNNISSFYEAFNIEVSIPEYNSFLTSFLDKNCIFIAEKEDITYPETVNYPNLLHSSNSNLNAGTYSIAAQIPHNTSIRVEFRSVDSHFNITETNQGWIISNTGEYSFNLGTQWENQLISLNIELLESGSAQLLIYENNSSIPTIIEIAWQSNETETISYPKETDFPNLLYDTSYVREKSSHSIAAYIPQNNNLKIEFVSKNDNYQIIDASSGWNIENETDLSFTLMNSIDGAVDFHLLLKKTGNATIFIYENNAIDPIVRHIIW